MRCYNLFSLSVLVLLVVGFSSNAQTPFSRFDFNSLPLTTATNGPNGTSVNSTAGTGGSGVRFATGGASVGVDLVVPGSSFNVTDLDVHIEYSRNESQADFFQRGNTRFYMNGGNLYFSYMISNATGGTTVATLGPAAAPPFGTSGVYTQIHVSYVSSTGEASVWINGSRVLYNNGPNNRVLRWDGAGNMVIGAIMDGSGGNFQTLGSIAFYSTAVTPLPVELISFHAAPKTDGVHLKWRTATELNNYGFEVERSLDRLHWETVGFVPGHGTTSSPKSYVYVDAAAGALNVSTVYYRLHQIDRDGADDYSTVLEVSLLEMPAFAVLPARPNPFNPSTTIGLRLDRESAITLTVHDAAGRQVASLLENALLPAGSHDIVFQAAGLPSGIYFAAVRGARGVETVKLVLQK